MRVEEEFTPIHEGVNLPLGMAAAVVGIGEYITRDELPDKVVRHMQKVGSEQNYKQIYSGFEGSWWSLEQETRVMFEGVQVGAMLYALDLALKALDAKRSDIGRVVVASALPGSQDLAEKTWPGSVLSAAACYSADLGLDYLLENEGNETDKLDAILSVDSMLGLRSPLGGEKLGSPYGRGISQSAVLQLFGDAAGAMLIPSNRLRVKWRATAGIEDKANRIGCAKVISPHGKKMEGYGGLIYENKKLLVGKVPEDGHEAVHMDAFEATKVMGRFLTLLRDETERQKGDLDWGGIAHAVIHHASEKIHKMITSPEKQLFRLGEDLAPFSPSFVNAPSVTTAMEWARIIPHLEEGDRILSIMFGAGAFGGVKEMEVE